jgi:hypothetical protein
LHGMHMYFASIIQAAGVITLCPVALHPIVVPILQWRLRRWQKLCVQQTTPIIRQRLGTILPENIGTGKEEPNDALQCLLGEACGVLKHTRRTTRTHHASPPCLEHPFHPYLEYGHRNDAFGPVRLAKQPRVHCRPS